jgi:hypothetical protein
MDPRAHALRDALHAALNATGLPVPVQSIAADLLGLHVIEGEIDCSGLLIPAERRIVLRGGEPQTRQRSPSPTSSATGCARSRKATRRRCSAEMAMLHLVPTASSSAKRTSLPRNC